mmetsp:Transcript_41869/g.100603  ORF Transcript_41869/g.100603 Transcript_41869/m.100603 type:complete len:203 (-) Transcript_41869:88-696(-)
MSRELSKTADSFFVPLTLRHSLTDVPRNACGRPPEPERPNMWDGAVGSIVGPRSSSTRFTSTGTSFRKGTKGQSRRQLSMMPVPGVGVLGVGDFLHPIPQTPWNAEGEPELSGVFSVIAKQRSLPILVEPVVEATAKRRPQKPDLTMNFRRRNDCRAEGYTLRPFYPCPTSTRLPASLEALHVRRHDNQHRAKKHLTKPHHK